MKMVYFQVFVVAVVERVEDEVGTTSLRVSRPAPEHRNGFPVSFFKPPNETSASVVGNREPRAVNVKMFRTEFSEKLLTKKKRLEEELSCPFSDLLDFGELK